MANMMDKIERLCKDENIEIDFHQSEKLIKAQFKSKMYGILEGMKDKISEKEYKYGIKSVNNILKGSWAIPLSTEPTDFPFPDNYCLAAVPVVPNEINMTSKVLNMFSSPMIGPYPSYELCIKLSRERNNILLKEPFRDWL